MNDFRQQYFQKLKEEGVRKLADNAPLINAFIETCEKRGLCLNNDNFQYIPTTGIVACHPEIVTKLCPHLSKDKEGLLDFNHLKSHYQQRQFSNGLLYGNEFVLMAHQYFRRGYHELNHFAPRFIDVFWGSPPHDVDLYIALDYDRVRINVDCYGYLELDTWYGAKFTRTISEIKDDIVKLRPPLYLDENLISFFFASAYSLDIKWETKGHIRTFQAEEFKTEEIKIFYNGIEYHPVRYIHAEFDLEQNVFRHFDGAIHFYSSEEYFRRRESDFNYNSKNSSKIKTASMKLFKLNGRIDVDTWIELSSHFFAGNPLIIEYFEGKYPQHILDMLQQVEDNETTGKTAS